jgi:hypothetical protein
MLSGIVVPVPDVDDVVVVGIVVVGLHTFVLIF